MRGTFESGLHHCDNSGQLSVCENSWHACTLYLYTTKIYRHVQYECLATLHISICREICLSLPGPALPRAHNDDKGQNFQEMRNEDNYPPRHPDRVTRTVFCSNDGISCSRSSSRTRKKGVKQRGPGADKSAKLALSSSSLDLAVSIGFSKHVHVANGLRREKTIDDGPLTPFARMTPSHQAVDFVAASLWPQHAHVARRTSSRLSLVVDSDLDAAVRIICRRR